MKTIGETFVEIDLSAPCLTVKDIIKHRGAQWINLADTFKTDNEERNDLILKAQELHMTAIKLLIQGISHS